MVLKRFREIFGMSENSDGEASEFIEIDLEQEKSDSKIYIKTYVLKSYEDVSSILASLREGYNIVVVDIRPLKQKDIVELKRAVSKIKKTVEALDGRIAGFGENTVIATPSKVFEIQKGGSSEASNQSKSDVDFF